MDETGMVDAGRRRMADVCAIAWTVCVVGYFLSGSL